MNIKKLLLSLGVIPLITLPIMTVMSCGNTDGKSLSEREFKTEQNVVDSITKQITKENVIDPVFNMNAQEILQKAMSGLTVSKLQHDFNFILTDFYDVYEFEDESGDIEVEVELESITVKTINKKPDNGNFQTATLDVKYKYEFEGEDSEEDVEIDAEGFYTKEIIWEIRPVISTQSDITKIKTMITSSKTNNSNIDLSDLKEYFLGEFDNDDDDIDDDDYGVFDRISRLQKTKDLGDFGGLIGYELKLSDIFAEIVPKLKKQITIHTSFFAPSAALNNIFVYPSTTGKLNYTFDEAALLTLDKSTILTYTTKDQLVTMLLNKTEINNPALLIVSGIIVEEVGPLLKLTVTFVDINTLPEVISINPALLKPLSVSPVSIK